MQNILEYLNQSLLFRNFIEVLLGLDNTLLLLIISLPVGFILSLILLLEEFQKINLFLKLLRVIFLLLEALHCLFRYI